MPRRKQRRNNPRRRLINRGDFLGLERQLLADDDVCVMLNPTRFLEIEEAVGNAVRENPDRACLDLVCSMLIDANKHVAAARAAVNRQFRTEDGPGMELAAAPEMIRESLLLKLRRAEDRLLELISTHAELRGRLARTRRTESRIEPGTLRLVRPAEPDLTPEAKAL